MERDELVKELEALVERAKEEGNPVVVQCSAAVLLSLLACIKENTVIQFMHFVLDGWTVHQRRRLAARRN